MFLSFALARIHNMPVLETNLTVCIPYVCFFVCEEYAKVSGILALVVLGLYMSQIGRTRISAESQETIHAVWSYIGFAAETAIFLLAGILISHQFTNARVPWIDFAKLFGLYFLLHIIRFLALIMCLPILRRMGYHMTVRHCVLVAYGGLRGAVGLALALMVLHKEFIPIEQRRLIMFHTSGIVVLTLLVNGTTTGLIVEWLHLSKETKISKQLMAEFLEKVEFNGK